MTMMQRNKENRDMERTLSIHYVIRGTKTIGEYKQVRAKMEALTLDIVERNKKQADWGHGAPQRVSFGALGNLWIQYEDGVELEYQI